MKLVILWISIMIELLKNKYDYISKSKKKRIVLIFGNVWLGNMIFSIFIINNCNILQFIRHYGKQEFLINTCIILLGGISVVNFNLLWMIIIIFHDAYNM